MQDTLDKFEFDAVNFVRLFNTPVCQLSVAQLRGHMDEIVDVSYHVVNAAIELREHVYKLLDAMGDHESE